MSSWASFRADVGVVFRAINAIELSPSIAGECVHKKLWYVNSLAQEYYGECRSGCLERSMGVRKKVLVYDKSKVKDRGEGVTGIE